jgi:hypothetical protein
MNATAYTADQWEAAWEEFADAQEAWDAAYPTRHRNGRVREFKKIARRLVAAKRALRELDAEFCDRQGIVVL